MTLDANSDLLRVRQHLMHHFGPPAEVVEVSGSPLPNAAIRALHISYFSPEGPDAPVLFATCGISEYAMSDGRCIEGMILLNREPARREFDAIRQTLASFALLVEGQDAPIRFGDVIHAPRELAPVARMEAVLFLPPVPFVEAVHKVELASGKPVEFVWLLPVYDAEARYSLEHGARALLTLLAAQDIDLSDFSRPAADLSLDLADAERRAREVAEDRKKRASERRAAPRSTEKLKSSRRSVGAGSFEVADDGDAVVVTRRGPERPKTSANAPIASSSGATREDSATEGETRPAPGGPIRGTQRPEPEPEIPRFDLSRDAAPRPTTDKPPAPRATPSQKRVSPSSEDRHATHEDNRAAEEKAKRVEELKTRARAAAERADARASDPKIRGDAQHHDAGQSETQSRKPVANRRGAPKLLSGKKRNEPKD